jgi:hypothetical protein
MRWTRWLVVALSVVAFGLGSVSCGGASKNSNRTSTVEEFKKSIPTNDVLRGRAPGEKGPHEQKAGDEKDASSPDKTGTPKTPADPTVKK